MSFLLTLDNYPAETSWNIKNSANQVVASGGNYTSAQQNTTVTVNLCLPNGCYTLTMNDSYGDGICCSYGNGSYSVKDNVTNAILTSGGQFGAQDVKTFCLQAQQGGLTDTKSTGFQVYPNPVDNLLHVAWTATQTNDATLLVTDLSGRTIIVHQAVTQKGNNRAQLNLSAVPSGIYFLRLQDGQQISQQKIVIRH